MADNDAKQFRTVDFGRIGVNGDEAEPGDIDESGSGPRAESVGSGGHGDGGGDSGRPTFGPSPSDAVGGKPVRRRGRPPGARNRDTSAPSDPAPRQARRSRLGLNVDTLGRQLVGAHQIATVVTGTDLVISDSDGKTLAEPIIAIADYYGLSASGPWVLWVNLVVAMAMVYGPKVLPLVMQRKSEAEGGGQQGFVFPG